MTLPVVGRGTKVLYGVGAAAFGVKDTRRTCGVLQGAEELRERAVPQRTLQRFSDLQGGDRSAQLQLPSVE